jgi:hypothetical protein
LRGCASAHQVRRALLRKTELESFTSIATLVSAEHKRIAAGTPLRKLLLDRGAGVYRNVFVASQLDSDAEIDEQFTLTMAAYDLVQLPQITG